jgi:hypothetical protein
LHSGGAKVSRVPNRGFSIERPNYVRGAPREDAKKPTSKVSAFYHLILTPLWGLVYVVAFTLMTIVEVMKLAWIKRREKQLYLERTHKKVIAVLLSFTIGLFYVLVFPLVDVVKLINKLVRDRRRFA